mgnify:CR=1 FL=1
MATGASAYTRLRKPEDGLSQSIQYWGGVEQRNADRLQKGIISAQNRAEREKTRKAKEDKYFRERYGADPSEYATTSTGFSTLDDVNRDAASHLINEEIRLSEMANEARNSGNFDEAEKIRMRMLKNRSNFKNYSEGMEKHEEILDTFQKASEKGEVSGYSKGFENFYQEALTNNNVIARPDKDGNLVYFATKKNKDGSTKVIDVPLQDVFSGKWRYYEKNDLDALTEEWVGNIGSSKVKRPDGDNYTLETDRWGNKHTKTANAIIESRLASDEFVADMVDQYDLYDEEGIDKENPPIGHEFSDETKELVKQKLLDRIKGAYDETYDKNWDSGRAVDRRARERMANKWCNKSGEERFSTLKYDAQQAASEGDYTLLKGQFESKERGEFSVTDIVERGDDLILKVEGDYPIRIPKTERGIIDFKINNTPSYKNINTSDVISAKPKAYRNSKVSSTEITKLTDRFFDSEGEPTGSDEEVVKFLRNELGIDAEDVFTFDTKKSIKVDGKEFSYSNKTEFMKMINSIMESGNLPEQPEEDNATNQDTKGSNGFG